LFATRRLLPESVVWLYANNRVAEAEQIIRNAAKLNNITMPDKILARSDAGLTVTADGETDGEMSTDESRKERGKFLNNLEKLDNAEDRSTRYTIVDIFRNRHLTINIVCMSLLWSVHKVLFEHDNLLELRQAQD